MEELKMSIKEMKREAKSQLSGNWKIAILNLFLVGILTTVVSEALFGIFGNGGVSSVFTSYTPESLMMEDAMIAPGPAVVSTLLSGVIGVVTSIFTIGYDWSILDMIDGKKLTVESLFQTLKSHRIFKVLGIAFVVNVFIVLWSLLLVIPGIIKSISYSQAYNIYKDDPDIDIMGSINRSKEIMNGNKWTYFMLQLSFLLWYLVPSLLFFIFIIGSVNTIEYQLNQAMFNPTGEVVSFFLGMLLILLAYILVMIIISFYVEPYRKTATQIFYRDLVGYPHEPVAVEEYESDSTDSVENIDPYQQDENGHFDREEDGFDEDTRF